jgi:hypothetical protein
VRWSRKDRVLFTVLKARMEKNAPRWTFRTTTYYLSCVVMIIAKNLVPACGQLQVFLGDFNFLFYSLEFCCLHVVNLLDSAFGKGAISND